jgi:hypothetical protein
MPLIFEAGAIPHPSKMHKIVGTPGDKDINLFSFIRVASSQGTIADFISFVSYVISSVIVIARAKKQFRSQK